MAIGGIVLICGGGCVWEFICNGVGIAGLKVGMPTTCICDWPNSLGVNRNDMDMLICFVNGGVVLIDGGVTYGRLIQGGGLMKDRVDGIVFERLGELG